MRFAGIGALGALNRPGVFNVLDGPAQLTQQGSGLSELLVELGPVARRLGGCQIGITHKCLFYRPNHTPRFARLPTQRAGDTCRRAIDIFS